METGSRKPFSRKQANVIFSAFKRGMLRSAFPNDGWVYDYADVEPDGNRILRSECIALSNITAMIFNGDYARAQRLMDDVFGRYPVLD